MALRIVPSAPHPTATPTSIGAPSAPGVHDTLRANLSLSAPPPKAASLSTSTTTQSFHPLEARLSRWRAQQDGLKMELLRRQFGIAEPVKRGMEMSIVQAGEWRPMSLGFGEGASVHADILAGRDTELDWEDVYTGGEMRETVDFHVEMEGHFGMAW
ncbi:hypothetical protein LTR56_012961 [Elasticomyces elasticus]|nr:hypothetical protein LTR56_012961 [Elasticomyces elasticus]KAK3667969.1 hypothetical protein LTR22_001036 [Elasticomyces elasticus]KAK4925091.1 hypothetical protein LTR49_007864 [Elasticomyces elasticus]KAK5767609.1 hypothetical protein LTS12_002110 [Elasticomyces elasticus]